MLLAASDPILESHTQNAQSQEGHGPSKHFPYGMSLLKSYPQSQ